MLPALVPLAVGSLLLGAVTACSAPTDPDAAGGESGDRSIVLAHPYENETLNPLLGFGDGVGKFYDGLLSYDADRHLRPGLATGVPRPEDGGKRWTVRLRKGVKFHDGSTLDARDVVATYRTMLDPKAGSTIRSEYSMIKDVTARGSDRVTFTLSYPYAPFPHRLRLGILPSERLQQDKPLEGNSLNTKPVGTGPYKLKEWRKGDRIVMSANDDYWGGKPKLKRVTVVSVPDDNTRAQRMRAGDYDGTVLPPALANGFANGEDTRVLVENSVDHRNVMLPMNNPVTGDRAVRRALNLAVDRSGMVDATLAGRGEPAYGPIPAAMKGYADKNATFPFDPAKARHVLDRAGWKVGKDGIRVKDGQQAKFTLMYPPEDSLRKDLSVAFASDARKIGIQVELAGLGWEAIQPRMGRDALLMGSGTPFDPDLQTYTQVHSSEAANGYNNPGSYSNPKVDAALDRARRTTDTHERQRAYHEAQRELIRDPARVFLVYLQHTYVLKGKWKGYEPVLEGHVHGTTGWGPWWNLEDWERAGGADQ